MLPGPEYLDMNHKHEYHSLTSIDTVIDYKICILHLRAMVLLRLKRALCWLRDYLYELYQVCRGYEPCIHDDCECYLHVDAPTFPECRQRYREHSARDLTDYVMEQFMQYNLEHEHELRCR